MVLCLCVGIHGGISGCCSLALPLGFYAAAAKTELNRSSLAGVRAHYSSAAVSTAIADFVGSEITGQDLLAFAVMALFALTNGWCSTLAMIYGPQQESSPKRPVLCVLLTFLSSDVQVTHPAEQHRAGVIMELGLILGIFAGARVGCCRQAVGLAACWPCSLAGSVLALLTQLGLH